LIEKLLSEMIVSAVPTGTPPRSCTLPEVKAALCPIRVFGSNKVGLWSLPAPSYPG
jgi:hypothetical protein